MKRAPQLREPVAWQVSLSLAVVVALAGLFLVWAVASAVQAALQYVLAVPTWLVCLGLLAMDQCIDHRWYGYRQYKHYGFAAISAAALHFHLGWELWLAVGTPAALSLSVSYVFTQYVDRSDFVDAST